MTSSLAAVQASCDPFLESVCCCHGFRWPSFSRSLLLLLLSTPDVICKRGAELRAITSFVSSSGRPCCCLFLSVDSHLFLSSSSFLVFSSSRFCSNCCHWSSRTSFIQSQQWRFCCLDRHQLEKGMSQQLPLSGHQLLLLLSFDFQSHSPAFAVEHRPLKSGKAEFCSSSFDP